MMSCGLKLINPTRGLIHPPRSIALEEPHGHRVVDAFGNDRLPSRLFPHPADGAQIAQLPDGVRGLSATLWVGTGAVTAGVLFFAFASTVSSDANGSSLWFK